ncbi:unnamed protein product [Linum tenue]|uniref:Cytochrome P450 n=1 Tax=Linum tenue TaxID=586396 RepID=A0AAV0HYX2_9ROSI|nr:unnamed protein product [Linum tenue]
MIQSSMASQGIKGPPYKFLHGNTRAINHMRSEAVGTPMELLSHDMLPRLMPHVYSWMTMVVNESLRLYPPAFNLTREVERETKLGNYILPAKLALSLPVIAIHHNPLLWGEDCHLFKPERFAVADGVAKAFLPFGFGPRTCVGSSFAAAEIKIALSMILQRYKLSLSPSYVHAPFHMLTICPKHGLQILLHPL